MRFSLHKKDTPTARTPTSARCFSVRCPLHDKYKDSPPRAAVPCHAEGPAKSTPHQTRVTRPHPQEAHRTKPASLALTRKKRTAPNPRHSPSPARSAPHQTRVTCLQENLGLRCPDLQARLVMRLRQRHLLTQSHRAGSHPAQSHRARFHPAWY